MGRFFVQGYGDYVPGLYSIIRMNSNAVDKQFDTIIVDASLPAKSLYLKRGYRETAYPQLLTENGDYLCYDVMEKASVHH